MQNTKTRSSQPMCGIEIIVIGPSRVEIRLMRWEKQQLNHLLEKLFC